MKNIFELAVVEEVIGRINRLTPKSTPAWGKMSVDQMLAHCNVAYELIYENKHPKPNALKKWMLKAFLKGIIVNEKPYKPGNPTAPEFLIKDAKNFEAEKARLIAYIQRTQQLGGAHFDQKESHSFGKLSTIEWNNMLYKHLDHHLRQFNV